MLAVIAPNWDRSRAAVPLRSTVLIAAAAMALLFTAACGLRAPRRAPASPPTLQVINSGWGAILVHFGGVRLGTVQNGSAACLELPAASESREVSVRSLLGGRLLYSSRIRPGDSSGWLLEVSKVSDLDRITLSEHQRCKRAGT